MTDNMKLRPCIMIVDDMEANRYILRIIITELGYRSVSAENGIQAQKILRQMSVQLILLDIAMPEMDGYEFCEWFRAQAKYRNIPVIFTSAYDDSREILQSYKIGGTDYIVKPFQSEIVKARVEMHMRYCRDNEALSMTNLRLKALVQEQLNQLSLAKQNILHTVAEMARRNGHIEDLLIKRMQENCRILAQALQLSGQYEEQITDGFVAAVASAILIYNIGYIAVPLEILKKEGELTEEENYIMMHHTTVGSHIIQSIRNEGESEEYTVMAEQIARSHHENWDGTGYPDGLKGEEIPLPAQIVAVVSDYCKLTSDMPDHPAYTAEEAFLQMKSYAGTKHNAVIVDTLGRVIRLLS